jgi:hypothetical protein
VVSELCVGACKRDRNAVPSPGLQALITRRVRLCSELRKEVGLGSRVEAYSGGTLESIVVNSIRIRIKRETAKQSLKGVRASLRYYLCKCARKYISSNIVKIMRSIRLGVSNMKLANHEHLFKLRLTDVSGTTLES